MPLPKPNKNENEQDFISRCAGNSTMNKEYPDNKQRVAVCYSQYRKSREDAKDIEIGRLQNTPIYDLTQLHPDFKAIYNSFNQQDSEDGFYEWLDDNHFDPREQFPVDKVDWTVFEKWTKYKTFEKALMESFNWKTSRLSLYRQMEQGRIYELEILTVTTSKNLKTYISDELVRSARTWVDKTPNHNHERYDLEGKNVILDCEERNGVIRALVYVEDPLINENWDKGLIKKCSIDGKFRSYMPIGERGILPYGLVGTSVAFLDSEIEAGIDATNVTVFEKLMEKLHDEKIVSKSPSKGRSDTQTISRSPITVKNTMEKEENKIDLPAMEKKINDLTKQLEEMRENKETKEKIEALEKVIKDLVKEFEASKKAETEPAKKEKTDEKKTVEPKGLTKEEVEKMIKEAKEKPIEVIREGEGGGKGKIEEKSGSAKKEPVSSSEAIATALRQAKGDTRIARQLIAERKIVDGEVHESNEYGTSQAGSAIPEIWASDVIQLTPRGGVLSGICKWYDDIKGKAGDTLHIPTLDTISFGDGSEYTEATGEQPTTSSVPVTISERIAYLKISREVLEDAVGGLVTALNQEIRDSYEHDLDAQILARLNTPVASTGIGGTLTTANLGSVGMTGSVIARLMGSFRAGTQEPIAMIIHPVTEAKLMQDEQFYDASEWGDSEIRQSGKVRSFLGLEILVSPQITSTGGTYHSFMVGKDCMGFTSKRDFTMDMDYNVQTRQHYWVATGRYGGTIIVPDRVWEVHTKDAS